jgi:hypothetical protein
MRRAPVPFVWLLAVLLALATGLSGWSRATMPVGAASAGHDAHAGSVHGGPASARVDTEHEHGAASPCMACLLAHALACPLPAASRARRAVAAVRHGRRRARPAAAFRWRPGLSRGPPLS